MHLIDNNQRRIKELKVALHSRHLLPGPIHRRHVEVQDYYEAEYLLLSELEINACDSVALKDFKLKCRET